MEGEPIPRDVALQICEDIRKEKARKLFTQCWGCMRFSKGDPAKMCFSSRPDLRGCGLINEKFDRMKIEGAEKLS